MNLPRMAWRNVFRNARRSAVTISAMTVALAALLVLSGLIRGLYLGMERDLVELELGDVQVHAPGYRNRPSIYERLEAPDSIIAPLEAAGFRVSSRLRGSGLAAGAKESAGAQLIGLDPARDATVSDIGQKVAEGRWLEVSDARGVVIGRKLAKSLHVGVGDTLLLLSTAADGSMANELYTVRGVLGPVGDGLDRSAVFLVQQTLRELLELPEGVHQLIVRRPPTVPLLDAKAAVVAAAPGQDVNTWKELMPTVAQLLQSTEGSMMLMFLVVYLAVGIVVLNAMLMAVFERIREFGVLKAVGMKPRTVVALVFLEGAAQTAIAVGLGLLLAVPALLYLSTTGIDVGSMSAASIGGATFSQHWVAVLDRQTFTGPIGALAFVVSVAIGYPALKAARLDPLEAIHHR